MQDLSDGHDLIREDGKGERAGFLGFVESATLSVLKGSSEGNSPVLSLNSSLWGGTYPRSHNWSASGLAQSHSGFLLCSEIVLCVQGQL